MIPALPEEASGGVDGALSRQAECTLGTVIATGPGTATVAVEAAVACERCAAGRGCGAALPGRGRSRRLQVSVPRHLDLEPGDTVKLALESATLLRAAWLAYGLPLTTMVAAVAAASASVESEAGAIASGAVGLVAGAAAARRLLLKERGIRRFVPVALERGPAGSRERRQWGIGH